MLSKSIHISYSRKYFTFAIEILQTDAFQRKTDARLLLNVNVYHHRVRVVNPEMREGRSEKLPARIDYSTTRDAHNPGRFSHLCELGFQVLHSFYRIRLRI